MYEDIYRKHFKFMADSIVDEIERNAYVFSGNDKNVLKEMCDEINQAYPRNPPIEYMSEISISGVPAGSSAIILKYIFQFESEVCRSNLAWSLIVDKTVYKVKIKDLDRIVMDLYHHFRASPNYAPPCGTHFGSPWCIYVHYDNAFRKLKSRKIVPELVEILKSRREVFILPFTSEMIARKWAPKELGKIMATHLMNKNVTRADVDMLEEGEYGPSLDLIAEQSVFNAIRCLRFYPSQENVRIISSYADHEYEELAKYAKAQAELMEQKLQEM